MTNADETKTDEELAEEFASSVICDYGGQLDQISSIDLKEAALWGLKRKSNEHKKLTIAHEEALALVERQNRAFETSRIDRCRERDEALKKVQILKEALSEAMGEFERIITLRLNENPPQYSTHKREKSLRIAMEAIASSAAIEISRVRSITNGD